MDENFLLRGETARRLYHEAAEGLPIVDYHCHLDPAQVADDHQFRSITELWLGGDHYKWRAMRANGVDERFITGEASDWEKFLKWAETVPYCMRNPLYHWTHMELRSAFGIDKLLSPATARDIYEQCNEQLGQPSHSARGLMRRYRVELVCTTDDPADTLESHRRTRESGFEVRMLPTWRPDKALAIERPESWTQYLRRLERAADTPVTSYDTLLQALRLRHAAFEAEGCRLSDHGIEAFPGEPCPDSEARAIFLKAAGGAAPTREEALRFRSALMLELARMDARAGWTQQFHYGPLRDTNTRMRRRLGPDSGFDSMGPAGDPRPMARFLDRLDSEGLLAQTILYCINPADNEMLATMAGNFQQGPVPGKIQTGSAWWFNDQLGGMERQLEALSSLGLLSRFVGMLTDSRSFLSYPRHEYFRRCLCDLVGRDVDEGLLPASETPFLMRMVADISYHNAKRYLRL